MVDKWCVVFLHNFCRFGFVGERMCQAEFAGDLYENYELFGLGG